MVTHQSIRGTNTNKTRVCSLEACDEFNHLKNVFENFFLKILFIHERERERGKREKQRPRQREKQAPRREPDAGFDPRTPGVTP